MPTAGQQRQQSGARARRASREPRTFTITSRRIPSRPPRGAEDRVPYLRLSGHWLERCGFGTDAVVAVKARQGRMVITILHPAPAPVQRAKPLEIAAPPQRRAAPRPRLGPMRYRLRRCAVSRGAGVHRVIAARTAELRAALRAEVDRR